MTSPEDEAFVSCLFRAQARHPGGSGDGLTALRTCALLGGTARQVILSGYAVKFMEGQIEVQA
jgi:hypothetical protein